MQARNDTISRTGTGKGILRRFLRDKRAAAAVEFAFIAPILLCLYFVTMEVSQAIETNKKVGRISEMVADLVTQQEKVTKADVDAIMQIGSAIIEPYNRSQPEIIVTAIQLSGEAGVTKADEVTATVAWSRKLSNGSFGPGPAEAETTIPEQLKMPGTFLVRVQTTLDYRPVITWSADQKAGLGLAAAFDNLSMSETSYSMHPRTTDTVPCEDCD